MKNTTRKMIKKKTKPFDLISYVSWDFYFCIFGVTDPLINQNIALTINRETAIIASHIAAFLIILSHESYFLLSPPEVNIRNHAYKTRHKVIVANIHNTQLIAVCIVWRRESSCCFSVHIVWIQLTPKVSQNHQAKILFGITEMSNKVAHNIFLHIDFLTLVNILIVIIN